MCHSGKWWYKMINREISLIAAVSHNGIIGVDGKIPWNIPEDLNHFKKLTMNGVVIMGRNTYESLKEPLSGRINIVVSKTLREIDVANEVILVRSLRKALELAKGFHKHIWLIGGYRIFKEGMTYADSIYITEVCVDVLKPGMTTYLQNPLVIGSDYDVFDIISRNPNAMITGFPSISSVVWNTRSISDYNDYITMRDALSVDVSDMDTSSSGIKYKFNVVDRRIPSIRKFLL